MCFALLRKYFYILLKKYESTFVYKMKRMFSYRSRPKHQITHAFTKPAFNPSMFQPC